MRPDKLILGALGATLVEHLRGEALANLPVLRMLTRPLEEIESEAQAWAGRLRAAGIPADVAVAAGPPGGGSLPDVEIPTMCVVLPGPSGRLLAALRSAATPVVARAQAGKVWLDPRTVDATEVDGLLAAVQGAWQSVHSPSAAE
jgi:L-seryl-tRNA(Ser) seleniumtransferase